MTKIDVRIIVFLFFLVISALIPLTFGDDLDWGGKGGIDRLDIWFENYNGRYLGNLIILFITRNTIVRIIFYAFINTGLVILIYKLSGSQKVSSYLIIIILLLGMPATVYGQTFGWFSGFANYNVGMFFSLLNMYLLKEKRHFLLLLTISICGQLFMENITLFNIFSAFYMFFLMRNQIKIRSRLSYIAGTVIGAFIMFNNNVYNEVISGNDSYRSIDTGSIIETIITKFTHFILVNNIMLLAVFSAILIMIYIKSKKNMIICIYTSAYTIFAIGFKLCGLEMENVRPGFSLVIFLMSIIFFYSVFYFVCTHPWVKQTRQMIIFWLISTIVILAPFLIISPFGPRGEFTSYIFLVIVVTGIWNTASVYFQSHRGIIVIRVAAISICAFILFVHSFNLYVFHDRMNHIQYSDDKKTMTISDVPFPHYGHNLSPVMIWRTSPRMFREYYNISKDTEIYFVPYKFAGRVR